MCEDAGAGDGGAAAEACGGFPEVFPLLGDALCHGNFSRPTGNRLIVHTWLKLVLMNFAIVELQSHMVVPQSMRILNHEMDDDRIECLHHHLKKVVLKGYSGRKHEMQLAIFLVRHARVLEVLKFLCENECSTKWLTNQKRQLQVDSRASLQAQFVFEKFSKSYIRFLKPASNISLVDPFDT